MYQRQAQGLASLGRGPDTELVHMTPREVGALNTLARQNGLDGLPTNPQTGLPEAGIFDSLAPILIGATSAALAPATGGASIFANPFFVGGMSALGAGIASGFDAAEMAKWGLGVGGGAALGGGLKAAGASTPAGVEASKQAALKAGTAPTVNLTGNLGAEGLKTTSAIGGGTLPASAQAGLNVGNIGRAFTTTEGLKAIPAAVGKAPIIAGIGSVAADQYSQMKDVEPFEFPKKEPPFYPEGGFMPPPRTSIDPFAGVPADVDFSEERMFFDPAPFTSPGYMPARAGGLVSLHEGGEIESAISGSAFDQVDADKKAGIFGGNQGLLPTTPSSGMLPTTPDNKEAIRKGGLKNVLERLLRSRRNGGEGPQFLGGTNQFDRPEIDINEFLRLPQYYAEAMRDRNESGPIQTQSKNQGGLLQGPGDGMSDDIMLPITGEDPKKRIAAVSPGEFVVSADVVAGLGNGSTSAGAKQLYGMMDRVRETRTGKTTQPRAIDAGKMMPA